MKIYVVNIKNKRILIDIKKDCLVKTIKYKILEEEGNPIFKQILHFNGDILKDNLPIDNYDIQENDVIIYMESKVGTLFYVKYSKKEKLIELERCSCCTSVLDLKRIIENRLGLKPECQELSYNRMIFDNDGNSLDFYGIEDGSVIDLKIIYK